MIYLVTLFVFLAMSKSETNCQALREGTFKTKNEVVNSSPIITIIERVGNIQYERSEQLGVEIKFEVEWIDDCSYKLIWLETIKYINNFGYPSDQILTIEITEVGSGYYKQITRSNKHDKILEGNVEVIE